MRVITGEVDVTTYFVIRKAVNATATTGATITDIDLQYVRAGEAASAKVDATALGSVDAAHADNKAIEVDATDQPGVYRIDWPDAAFAEGVNQVVLSITLTDSFAEHLLVDLVASAVGAGAASREVLVQDEDPAPIADASVWLTTDEAGTNVVAGTLQTNASGIVTFYVDAGETYYAWARKFGVNFTNPATWVVGAGGLTIDGTNASADTSTARYEPISLAGAKRHLRVDHTVDDALIESLISAARADLEARTSQQWMYRTHTVRFDYGFPPCIEIPLYPLVEVADITYVDTAGATQTLAADQYQVSPDRMPGLVVPAYSASWPSTQAVIDAVAVTYVAGYNATFTADAATNVITAVDGGRTWTDGDEVMLRKSGDEDAALYTGLSEQTIYYVISASGSTFKLSATSGGAEINISGTSSGTLYVGAELPSHAISAMRLHIGSLHEHRESVVVGTIVSKLKGSVAYESLVRLLIANPRA